MRRNQAPWAAWSTDGENGRYDLRHADASRFVGDRLTVRDLGERRDLDRGLRKRRDRSWSRTWSGRPRRRRHRRDDEHRRNEPRRGRQGMHSVGLDVRCGRRLLFVEVRPRQESVFGRAGVVQSIGHRVRRVDRVLHVLVRRRQVLGQAMHGRQRDVHRERRVLRRQVRRRQVHSPLDDVQVDGQSVRGQRRVLREVLQERLLWLAVLLRADRRCVLLGSGVLRWKL